MIIGWFLQGLTNACISMEAVHKYAWTLTIVSTVPAVQGTRLSMSTGIVQVSEGFSTEFFIGK